MKYYATLLNLNTAKEFSLEQKDLFNPNIQESLLNRIMCGGGETEDEALENALDNLVDEGVIEICKCGRGVEGIVTTLHLKQALRHLWLEHDEYHGDFKLHAMAYHNSLVDFCDRYNITEDAQAELESLFNAIMHTAI